MGIVEEWAESVTMAVSKSLSKAPGFHFTVSVFDEAKVGRYLLSERFGPSRSARSEYVFKAEPVSPDAFAGGKLSYGVMIHEKRLRVECKEWPA